MKEKEKKVLDQKVKRTETNVLVIVVVVVVKR